MKKANKYFLFIISVFCLLSVIALTSCSFFDDRIFRYLILPGVSAIGIDASGAKWFGFSDSWVGYLDDNGTPIYQGDDIWTTFTMYDLLGANFNISAIAFDASGGKWFGTGRGGISYLNDNGTPTDKADDTWATFRTTDGLADNWVNAVVIDSSGGKWFGTGSGVSYLNDNGTPTDKADDIWTTFTTPDWVSTVVIDASGGKWFGTGSGVSYLNDNGTPANKADDIWITFTSDDGLANDWVYAVAIDASGGKWFGTFEPGLSYFNDNGTPANKADDIWTTFTTADGLAIHYVEAVAIDASGGKWFGTGDRVSYLNDNGTPANKADDIWTIFTIPCEVDVIAIDSSGVKWFGTCNGVCYCL